MKSDVLLFALALCAHAALAAPPSDHLRIDSLVSRAGSMSAPDVPAAGQHPDVRLPQQGIVRSFVNTGGYTYIEVEQGAQTLWIAAQTVAVKKGDTIHFDNGALMSDFYSKTLNRTFPEVTFVSLVLVSRN